MPRSFCGFPTLSQQQQQQNQKQKQRIAEQKNLII
jgi:hypothetical protein